MHMKYIILYMIKIWPWNDQPRNLLDKNKKKLIEWVSVSKRKINKTIDRFILILNLGLSVNIIRNLPGENHA